MHYSHKLDGQEEEQARPCRDFFQLLVDILGKSNVVSTWYASLFPLRPIFVSVFCHCSCFGLPGARHNPQG